MMTENLDELDEYTDTDETETDEAIADAENEPEFLPFPIPGLPSPFGGRSRAPRTGGRQNYFQPRPMANYVTQTQLRAALTRVRNDVRINATAIKSVNTRINGVETRQAKSNTMQAKQIAGVKNDLKKTKDMNLMMFLLTRPKTTDTATTAVGNVGGATIPIGSKLVYETGSGNSLLLPLILMGGLGDSGSGGGSDSNMLLMVLALSGGL